MSFIDVDLMLFYRLGGCGDGIEYISLNRIFTVKGYIRVVVKIEIESTMFSEK